MPTTQLDTKVKTGEVRLSYCHLFEPYAFDEYQDAKYSVQIIIPKEDKATIERIQRAYNNAKEEGIKKFGQGFAGKATALKRMPGSDRGLLRDADEWPELKEDFPGCYVMNLKSSTAPGVLAKETGMARLTKENGSDIVYSGCYGIVTFNIYPYNKVGAGITAGLNNVLKTRDGDYLGGRASAESDFSEELEDTTGYADLL